MKVDIYFDEHKGLWDKFVKTSKNGTFLFYRDFMDYHSNRFNDFSLIFYKKDQPIALLPGNLKGAEFHSHQGLTYGGLIVNEETTATDVLDIFEYIIVSLQRHGVKEFIYKPIPHIYHQIPSEEDLYALFIHSAQIVGRGISSAINLSSEQPAFSKLRRRNLKKANMANIKVRETDDFAPFWDILSENLKKKYNTEPAHSLNEIQLLRSRFPENIKLYGAYTLTNELIGGIVVFNTTTVAHTQYIAANKEGLLFGAIDIITEYIIEIARQDKDYFDFGVSTENNGLYLNKGLISQKEGFGARAVTYDIYSIKLN